MSKKENRQVISNCFFCIFSLFPAFFVYSFTKSTLFTFSVNVKIIYHFCLSVNAIFSFLQVYM